MRFHFKEIFGDEVLNLFITTHHQPQHRRLHAAHGEYPLIARITPEDGVGAGHVDPVQPVSARARKRRDAQRDKLAVGTQTRDRTLYRLRVEVVYQAALYLLAFFRRQLEVVQHFIYQQLSFPVRVTCVNHFRGFVQETLDHVQLFGHRRPGLQAPFFRHDGQIVEVPAGVAAVVDLRLRLLKQVTNTPGHHLPVTAFDKAVALAVRLRQHVGDGARQARLFGNKQPHRINGSQSSVGHRVRSPARRSPSG